MEVTHARWRGLEKQLNKTLTALSGSGLQVTMQDNGLDSTTVHLRNIAHKLTNALQDFNSQIKNVLWKQQGHPQLLKSAALQDIDAELRSLNEQLYIPKPTDLQVQTEQQIWIGRDHPLCYLSDEWRSMLLEALCNVRFSNFDHRNLQLLDKKVEVKSSQSTITTNMQLEDTLRQVPQLLRDLQDKLKASFISKEAKNKFHVQLVSQDDLEMAVYQNQSSVSKGLSSTNTDSDAAMLISTDFSGQSTDRFSVYRELWPLLDAVSLRNEVLFICICLLLACLLACLLVCL